MGFFVNSRRIGGQKSADFPFGEGALVRGDINIGDADTIMHMENRAMSDKDGKRGCVIEDLTGNKYFNGNMENSRGVSALINYVPIGHTSGTMHNT